MENLGRRIQYVVFAVAVISSSGCEQNLAGGHKLDNVRHVTVIFYGHPAIKEGTRCESDNPDFCGRVYLSLKRMPVRSPTFHSKGFSGPRVSAIVEDENRDRIHIVCSTDKADVDVGAYGHSTDVPEIKKLFQTLIDIRNYEGTKEVAPLPLREN